MLCLQKRRQNLLPYLLMDQSKIHNSVDGKTGENEIGANFFSVSVLIQKQLFLFLPAYLIVTIGVIVQLDNSRCYSGKGLKCERKMSSKLNQNTINTISKCTERYYAHMMCTLDNLSCIN